MSQIPCVERRAGRPTPTRPKYIPSAAIDSDRPATQIFPGRPTNDFDGASHLTSARARARVCNRKLKITRGILSFARSDRQFARELGRHVFFLFQQPRRYSLGKIGLPDRKMGLHGEGSPRVSIVFTRERHESCLASVLTVLRDENFHCRMPIKCHCHRRGIKFAILAIAFQIRAAEARGQGYQSIEKKTFSTLAHVSEKYLADCRTRASRTCDIRHART